MRAVIVRIDRAYGFYLFYWHKFFIQYECRRRRRVWVRWEGFLINWIADDQSSVAFNYLVVCCAVHKIIAISCRFGSHERTYPLQRRQRLLLAESTLLNGRTKRWPAWPHCSNEFKDRIRFGRRVNFSVINCLALLSPCGDRPMTMCIATEKFMFGSWKISSRAQCGHINAAATRWMDIIKWNTQSNQFHGI